MPDKKSVSVLTLNPGMDKIVYLDMPLKYGEMNRYSHSVENQGSKGANQAIILKNLGCEVNYYSFTGGDCGRKCESILESYGIFGVYADIGTDIRQNIKIIDKDKIQTEVNAKSCNVTEAAAEKLLDEYLGTSGDIISICGSVPDGISKDIYGKLISEFAKAKKITVLDASGEALAEGLKAAPTLIKPNRFELAELCGTNAREMSEKDVLKLCGEIYGRYGTSVICTLDSDGAVYVGDGGEYKIPVADVPQKGFSGAGDTFLAAFIQKRFIEELSVEYSLYYAAAAAGAKVAMEGTALPTKAEIEAVYSKMKND